MEAFASMGNGTTAVGKWKGGPARLAGMVSSHVQMPFLRFVPETHPLLPFPHLRGLESGHSAVRGSAGQVVCAGTSSPGLFFMSCQPLYSEDPIPFDP